MRKPTTGTVVHMQLRTSRSDRLGPRAPAGRATRHCHRPTTRPDPGGTNQRRRN
jgi:hypothetical protein